MLRGKKGFDRLAYACKNVLNKATTWLFINLAKSMYPMYQVLHILCPPTACWLTPSYSS